MISRSKILFWWLKQKAKKTVRRFPLTGKYKRIYHFHIRKSAGTSINAAFWGLAGKTLQNVGRSPLIVANNFVFVRHHRDLVKKGNYHFANSHASFEELTLPENTFSFAIFRDPVERVFSLYKYYHFNVYHPDAHKLDPMHLNAKKYNHWLGESFSDFLQLTPRKHIENQLFMFSEKFNVSEAISNVKKLNKLYFQSNLSQLELDIELISGLKINISRERSFPNTAGEMTPGERILAESKLHDEINFYKQIESFQKEYSY